MKAAGEMVPEKIDWRHVLVGVLVIVVLGALVAALPAVYMDIDPDVGKAGVIKLNGPIMQDSNVGASGFSPEDVRTLTKRAQDDRADVIIYEINSPGGSVVASKDATRAVEQADVPTVCLMKEAAASGAYWMSTACDRIVADSLTITGSIGATSAYLEFSDLLEEYGVDYVNLTAGEYKDMGSRYRDMEEEEREKFDHLLDTVHREFIRDIAENRGMDVETVGDAATGEIYLGTDAQDLGLVDTLGSSDTARDVAKNLTDVNELREEEYEPPQRLDLFSLFFAKVGEGMVDGLRAEQEHGIMTKYR